LEDIFSEKLQNYLDLIDFLDKVEVEDVQDIFIITGGEVFKSCLLRIGEKQVTNSEMIEIYHKIINEQEVPLYHHVKLDLGGKDKTYLIIKTIRSNSKIDRILDSMKPYLEMFYYYSLEIIILFLFPSLIKLKPSKSSFANEIVNENKSLLQNLKNSKNYGKEFNLFMSKVIQGSLCITPDLQL
jgi:hypothetical protein